MIRISYVKVHSQNQTGIITVAMNCPDKDGKNYTADFAFCSPTEKSFVKKIGRLIATRRLESERRADRKQILSFEFEGPWQKAMIHALNLLVQKDSLPRWFKSFIQEDPNVKFTYGLRDNQKDHVLDVSFVTKLEGTAQAV